MRPPPLLSLFIVTCIFFSPALGQTTADLRPTFMGVVYRFEGGPDDGRLGYLFRIWNRSGADQSLSVVPGRFDQPVLAVLSAGGRFADGTPSWAGDPPRFDPLFDAGPETLRSSPSLDLADRPANIVVLTTAAVTQIVYTLNGRTATGALSAAQVEVIRPGGLSGRLEVTAVTVVRRLAEGDELALTVANGLSEALSQATVKAYPAASDVTLSRNTLAVGALASGVQTTTTETLLAHRTDGAAYAPSDFVFAFDDAGAVLGLDLNADGVRDDIEALIEQELAGSPRNRAYLRAFAKALRTADAATTSASANAAMDQIEDLSDCLFFEIGPSEAGSARIELESANTEARVRRVLEFWRLISNRTSRVLPDDAAIRAFCESSAALSQ